MPHRGAEAGGTDAVIRNTGPRNRHIGVAAFMIDTAETSFRPLTAVASALPEA